MAHAREPAKLTSVDALEGVWDAFRAGEGVLCARDDSALALSVDATVGVYRFVCVSCGHPSPWFEVGPSGLRIRNPLPGPATSTAGED